MKSYRVFISYLHEDLEYAEEIERVLKEIGHCPYRDKTGLRPGMPLTDQITRAISRSHFLVLVITSNSIRSSEWVQQEVGYALGCQVPAVPISINISLDPLNLPPLIGSIIPIEVQNLSELEAKLRSQIWESFLNGWKERGGGGIFEYDANSADRPLLLAQKASDILDAYGPVLLRQRSALSSFSLPRNEGDPNWKDVVDPQHWSWFQPKERINLEAVAAECRLVIDPEYFPKGYLKEVQRAKLNTLRDSLAEMDDNKIQVVFKRFLPAEGLTILGNHWALLSAAVPPAETKRQSLSTWHAPTVDEYCKDFDEEFNSLWKFQEKRRCGGLTSRSYAIVRIDCALDHLD